ncbi:pyridoxamine 5'-phosphate oxidase [Cucumibacter marinus]|uniref:pyridoxamine 5'-phosphate oxidase n=1 Tax=Cucumibacter marinus TaxID=1121252 RepID=UPI000416953B|nr:pyridoxamine 5'-phosphate oxidase [Cucumibacter marinus]
MIATSTMDQTASFPDLFADDGAQKPDPFAVFDAWLAEAERTEPDNHNAMSLATVDADGLPDVRIVLLKARTDEGFTFFTNFESAKGRELLGQPRAALNFYWKSSARQIRIRGTVEPVPDATADAYFATRPRGSQIGAHASIQSRALESRQALIDRVRDLETRFEGADVPRPDHWSGFLVTPLYIEFWQNGEFRLHDRLVYRRDDSGADWAVQRLFP